MPHTVPACHSVRPASVSGLLRHPEAQELADLVQELYTEGTLTYQELRELSHMPELHVHLRPSVERIDPSRRMLMGAV